MLPSSVKGGGVSSPPFPMRYSGDCIVAGNAEGLHDDLAAAREILGDVPVIAVNGASREVKAIALFSKHPDRYIEMRWISHQRRLFGDGFTVHAPGRGSKMPWVNYWWPDAEGRGGSAWGARKLACLIGFDRVVLCGCPLEPGPYCGGHNLGGFMHRTDVCDNLFDGIKAETDWHGGAHSMSGRTKELLGLPDDG